MLSQYLKCFLICGKNSMQIEFTGIPCLDSFGCLCPTHINTGIPCALVQIVLTLKPSCNVKLIDPRNWQHVHSPVK